MKKIFVIMTILAFLLGLGSTSKAALLTVSSNGTITTSSILENNQWYQIEARGTFVYDSCWSRIADAEWAQKNNPDPPDWVENRNYVEFDDGLDLLVNDISHDWMGTTDGTDFSSHVYSPIHVYRLNWLGTGETINFQIIDNAYSDNSGSLEVEITPIPEPATLLLLGLGAVILRKRRV